MNQDVFSANKVTTVEYQVLFLKRDFESVLFEAQDVITQTMSATGFIAWKTANFVNQLNSIGIMIKQDTFAVLKNLEGVVFNSTSCGYQPGLKLVSLTDNDYQYLRVNFQILSTVAREEANYKKDQTVALDEIAQAMPSEWDPRYLAQHHKGSTPVAAGSTLSSDSITKLDKLVAQASKAQAPGGPPDATIAPSAQAGEVLWRLSFNTTPDVSPQKPNSGVASAPSQAPAGPDKGWHLTTIFQEPEQAADKDPAFPAKPLATQADVKMGKPVSFRAAVIRAEPTIFFQALDVGERPVSWDFGDGSISEALSPQHTYTQNGSYNVRFSCQGQSYEENFEVLQHGKSISAKNLIHLPKPKALSKWLASLETFLEGVSSDYRDDELFSQLQALMKTPRASSQRLLDLAPFMGIDPLFAAQASALLQDISARILKEGDTARRQWLVHCYQFQATLILVLVKFQVWDIKSNDKVHGLLEEMVKQISAFPADVDYQLPRALASFLQPPTKQRALDLLRKHFKRVTDLLIK